MQTNHKSIITKPVVLTLTSAVLYMTCLHFIYKYIMSLDSCHAFIAVSLYFAVFLTLSA